MAQPFTIKVKDNIKQFTKGMNRKQREQVPFAVATALNATAFDLRKYTISRIFPNAFKNQSRAKGAPIVAQMKRAQAASEEAPTIGGIKMKKLGKSKPGGYKSLVTRHLGAKAAEKIDKADGSKLVAKGKKTGNTDLIRKGNFIKNVIGRK